MARIVDPIGFRDDGRENGVLFGCPVIVADRQPSEGVLPVDEELVEVFRCAADEIVGKLRFARFEAQLRAHPELDSVVQDHLGAAAHMRIGGEAEILNLAAGNIVLVDAVAREVRIPAVVKAVFFGSDPLQT